MNKLKKAIFLLGILLLLIIIIVILIYIQEENKSNIITQNDNGNVEYVLEEKVIPIESFDEYAIIQQCIKAYREIYEEQDLSKMMNIVEEEWKKAKKVTNTNLLQQLQEWQVEEKYIISEAYVKSGYTFSKYYVKVKQPQNNIYFIINKDNVNFTFSIEPITNEEYSKAIQDGIAKLEEKEIQTNENNSIEIIVMSEEDIVKELIKQLQFYLLYDNRTGYELLEEEYRNKRFGSYEEFQKYIEDNKNQIENMTLMSYGVELGENTNKYTAVDINNNYYTFITTGVFDYTIELDNYTILTEEFKTSYKEASVEEKVFNNINLFYKMINTKDYKHAYNLLANGFKQNYFKTQEDFETYVKENFYDYNIITLDNIEEKNELYLCKVNIKPDNRISSQSMQKTIIIQLGEETEFVLSFEV